MPDQQASGFREAIKKMADSSRTKQPTPEPESEPAQNVLTTLKPDEQYIGSIAIEWRWVRYRYTVIASYYRDSNNVDNASPGNYLVRVERADSDVFTADECQKLGVIMLSAAEWAENWQQHVGSFLAVEPGLKPIPGVGPTVFEEAVEITPDGEDDA